MERERFIIDCDPGHDDSYALALIGGLKDRLKIEALIASHGNSPLEKTLRNALNLAQAFNLECPVYRGSESPLLRDRINAPKIHGESGLDGPVFPPCTRVCEGNGIEAALKLVRDNPGEISFLSVGPWTDLAICIKADPDFSRNLKRIVLMGGSMGAGNVTQTAEFNVFADPEAAQIVLNCGREVHMFGLDVTLQLQFGEQQYERARNLPESESKRIFLASMDFYTSRAIVANNDRPAMHDPCTVAFLADPGIFEFERHNVIVDCKSQINYGRTVAGKVREDGNVLVGVKADRQRFWDLFFTALSRINQDPSHYSS